ncbi:putative mitochondrial protein AtMg00860 [Apium graveolens]|uniref:putative mitochondrial protein AtMg00860 n=1 Tax=Apium graveolens TaxID=4045 RepID=UPI003D79C433
MIYHVKHLKLVFEALRRNQLFIWRKKCDFATSTIEYMGHIVSSTGVAADDKKIQAMLHWPRHNSVRALRSFLGLTGYYRSFVMRYEIMAKPLTQLLKTGAFIWDREADNPFDKLK